MKIIGRLLNKKYYIYIILAIAFFLRVVLLSKYPYGMTPDEASFGYDAFLLALRAWRAAACLDSRWAIIVSARPLSLSFGVIYPMALCKRLLL